LPVAREPYAVGYDRLSRFRPSEHAPEIAIGNDRQHAENVDAADPLGGLRERFTDKGKSLSRFRTSDPDDFLALLDAVRSGRVTHVLIWNLDRVLRDDEVRVALIAACRENGAVIVQTSTGTVIDPDDPDSVFLATILGAVAVLEIEKMSKRIRAFKQARRDAGLPHGGKRWFGYLPGNMELDPVEAPILRDLIGRFIQGEALHALARDLTVKGVPTVYGGKWTGPNLRALLGHPRNAGLMTHEGEVIGSGKWPAIIDAATHETVARKLGNPARRTTTSNARVYLLAGLAVCAECGAPLRGRPLHNSTKTQRGGEYGARAYACATGRHVHRSVAYVDEVLEALVIERLSRVDMSGALVDDDAADEARALSEDRDALRDALGDLLDMLGRGEISAAAYASGTARIEQNLAALDEAISAASERAAAPVAILDGMTGDGARAAWASADLGRRRALVGLLTTRVALRGGRGPFRPAQVEVEWRASL
jgi:DNA invertase Pin-like site-specific DNA recombinase